MRSFTLAGACPAHGRRVWPRRPSAGQAPWAPRRAYYERILGAETAYDHNV